MSYNITNVTSANNFVEQVSALNQLSGGYIGAFMLAAVFFVAFIINKRSDNDTKETLLVSSTITSVIAVLLWGVELISWHILIYPIVLLVVSLMVYVFSS